MNREYINSTKEAQRAVGEIVELVNSGAVRPLIAFDIETSPMVGLVGYPGSQVDDNGEVVRANKKTYLEYCQRLWMANFIPEMLNAFGLYVPNKTISGKETDGVTAQQAWQFFHDRVEQLTDAELEKCRWTARDHGLQLMSALGQVQDHLEQLAALDAQIAAAVKGKRPLESTRKKTAVWLAGAQDWAAFLTDVVPQYIDRPLPLSILRHVLRVGVEGRVYLNKNGQNRMDPVRPGLDPYTTTIFLVQLTLVSPNGETSSWLFNTNEGKVDFEALRPVMEGLDGKVLFIGHNIKFDLGMWMHHAGYAPKNVYCTQIGSRMLLLGLKVRHSLAEVAKRFIDFELSKEARSTFIGRRYDEPTLEQQEYAYVDTEILPAIYDKQVETAAAVEQTELIHNFGRLSWITAKWELDGYPIDTQSWMEIAAGAARDRDATAAELEQMLLPPGYADVFAAPGEEGYVEESGDDDDEDSAVDVRPQALVRISQTKLVGELLSNVLRMPVTSLAKQARSNLERDYRLAHRGEGHPFFQRYALWSKLAKQASTYGKRFLWYIHPLTGKIHPNFHIAGTDTARYSSTGPNWLNIPAAKEPGDPDFRGAIISEDGRYFLGADFETMELRIAGDISKDPLVKRMAESGADAHSFTAANMFHIEKANVTAPTSRTNIYRRGSQEFVTTIWQVPQGWTAEQVAEFALTPEVVAAVKEVKEKYGKDITRTDAKSVTFLWLFQGTPFTLAERTGLSLDHCDLLFSSFAGVYSTMDGHMKQIAEDAITCNVVVEDDGSRYGYSVGYGGIRRYSPLPVAPWRGDFPNEYAWYTAAKEFKRQVRRVQRELCNLPMQGGNAVITCEALLKMVESGSRLGVYPKFAIYDEIICEAPDRVKPFVTKSIIEQAMLGAAERYMLFVPPGAEADVKKAGKAWVKS